VSLDKRKWESSGASVLQDKTDENPLSHLQQDAQSQVASIAIAVSLTHQSFGAIVLTFHKAIGEARWQKIDDITSW